MDWETRLKALLDAIAPDIKALEDAIPVGAGFGQELAYAEKTTDFASTNTVAFAVGAGALVTGLSITVDGTGRPFDLEFYSLARHSVANSFVAISFVVDGASDGSLFAEFSPSTTVNRSCLFRRRMAPIAVGVSKTFQVASYTPTAGTVTWAATANNKMWLSAVNR